MAIYESLSAYGNWLDQHPSVEALDDIYQPGSPAYAAVAPITQTLVDNGWRWDGPTAMNEDVAFGDTIDARSVTVIVVSRSLLATLVVASGTPVADQPPSAGDARLLVQLALGDDDRWRIASNQILETLEG